MTDIYNTIKTFLLADAGVSALVSTRIYIEVGLPAGYTISTGKIITMHPIEGKAPYYEVTNDTIMFSAWSQSAQGAIDLNQAIFEAFEVTNNPAQATSIYALPKNRGRLIRAPGDLYFMMSTYEIAEVQ